MGTYLSCCKKRGQNIESQELVKVIYNQVENDASKLSNAETTNHIIQTHPVQKEQPKKLNKADFVFRDRDNEVLMKKPKFI